MYARMSQRDIAATIEDIYGFQMSYWLVTGYGGIVRSSRSYPFAFVDWVSTYRCSVYWRPDRIQINGRNSLAPG